MTYSVYSFFKSMSGITVLSSIVCLCYFIGNPTLKRKLEFVSDIALKSWPTVAKKTVAILLHIFMIIALLLGSNFIAVNILSCDDIRAMPDGTYCYYVEATNEKGKTYTLPANIQKTDEYYQVYNVYFNNGGYLYFGGSCSDFEYDESSYCYDQSDRQWEIELTNIKTYHKAVKETSVDWSLDDTSRIISVLLQAIVILMHILSVVRK